MWWTALPLLWSLIWGPPAVSRTVSGLVVDARGKPVPAAQVELLRSREAGALPSLAEDRFYRADTGADGRFEIPLVPPGRFDLLVWGSGFAPLERVGLEVPDGNLGRFVLERGADVSIRVTGPEGQPLEGVEAWVVPRDPRDWEDYYRQGPAAVSGPEGGLELPDLTPGRSVSLDVCRSGYLPASFAIREVPGDPIEVVLERAARISGRVVDPAGAPAGGARLVAWLSGESPERPESLRPCLREAGFASADAEGRFTLEPLPPGWWSIRASATGWLPAEMERRKVRGDEHLEGVEIVLGQGAAVSGRVLSPDGSPVAGAQVQVLGDRSGPEALSGADGAYRLEGVATGERTVEATHPEYEFAGRTFDVVPGENRLDLKLERDRRREIRGRILGQAGAPVAGARVLGPSSSAWSAADGSFKLLERDGRHEVWAQAEGYAPAQTAVTVEGGPVSGIEVRLSRGGSLRGRLLGLDREDLASATVETALPPLLQRRNAVDPQGGWRMSGLPPGTWEVTARSGGRSVTERVELAPDQEEAVLDLDFPPVFEVSGRVLDPDGQPVADATVRLFTGGRAGTGGWAFTRSNGSFRIEVEEGAYRGFALKEGYLSARLEEPVQVEAGPVEGLELMLGRGTALRGRILGLEPGERAREIWAEGPGGAIRLGELDQEAQYAVFGLVPGEWKVKASFEGREAAARLTIDEGQEEAFVDLAFEEASEDDQPGQ